MQRRVHKYDKTIQARVYHGDGGLELVLVVYFKHIIFTNTVFCKLLVRRLFAVYGLHSFHVLLIVHYKRLALQKQARKVA